MILLAADSWEMKQTPQKGRGIFATKAIPAGTVIGDYLGKVIRTAQDETLETDIGLYLMYYHDQATIYPADISSPGVHVLNHSCNPNAWIATYYGHTLFFALRHIFAGEEITVSYLLSPLDESCQPCIHACYCGESNCTTTMHQSPDKFEKWVAFNAVENKKTKRKKITYGKLLPKLTIYPTTIPDHPIYSLRGSTQQAALICNNKQLPTIKTLRKLIRQSGRRLHFPHLQTTILGVDNNVALSVR